MTLLRHDLPSAGPRPAGGDPPPPDPPEAPQGPVREPVAPPSADSPSRAVWDHPGTVLKATRDPLAVVNAVGTAIVLVLVAVLALRGDRVARPGPAAPPAGMACAPVEGLDFDVCLTSWWRSAEHNERVGGAADSNHLLGCAFDLVPHPATAENVVRLHRFATDHQLDPAIEYVEPGTATHDTHVHIDFRCQERGAG